MTHHDATTAYDDPYAPAEATVDPYLPPAPGFSGPAPAPAPAPVVPYAQPVYVAPAATPDVSGLAIAGMVLSIIGLGLVGAILGHIALGDCTARGDKSGRTMALVAIWLGWAQVVFAVAIFLFAIIFNIAIFASIMGAASTT